MIGIFTEPNDCCCCVVIPLNKIISDVLIGIMLRTVDNFKIEMSASVSMSKLILRSKLGVGIEM